MKIYKITLIALLAIFIGACNNATEQKKADGDANKTTTEKTDETKPAEDKKVETAPASLDTPTDTLKTFVQALKAEDEAAIKNTLSDKTVKMFDVMAKGAGKSFYESLTENDKDGELKEMPKTQNEKINGDKATLEVKGKNNPKWDTIPFVKEDGKWKIAFLDEKYDGKYEKLKKEAEKKKPEGDQP